MPSIRLGVSLKIIHQATNVIVNHLVILSSVSIKKALLLKAYILQDFARFPNFLESQTAEIIYWY